MICLHVRGGAGLAPAAGLIRELVRLLGVTHHSPAAAVSRTQTGTTWTLRTKPEDQSGCLQMSWTTSSVSTPSLDEYVWGGGVALEAVLARRAVRATASGYSAALRFAGEAAIGARLWAIEGTGTYGAGLARYLAGRGETALETAQLEHEILGHVPSLAQAAVLSRATAPRASTGFQDPTKPYRVSDPPSSSMTVSAGTSDFGSFGSAMMPTMRATPSRSCQAQAITRDRPVSTPSSSANKARQPGSAETSEDTPSICPDRIAAARARTRSTFG